VIVLRRGLRPQPLFISHSFAALTQDAEMAGTVAIVIHTYRDRIGRAQALACHPLPRMCSLSQGMLFKWRSELMNEETPIERRPLLRSPPNTSIGIQFTAVRRTGYAPLIQ